MAMLAASFFFWIERDNVAGKWRTSLTVSALITGIAAVHYFYMREVWGATSTSPTALRYIDWTLTVPLMCVEFYLILNAVKEVSSGILTRLLAGSVIMLVFGYLGEAGVMNYWAGFGIGMVGWAIVLYEVFMGEASKVNAESASPALKSAFGYLRLFALVGWSIYPIGYYMNDPAALNIAYNIADAINKIGWGLIIYVLAVRDSKTA
jgi:bacteriorhodopsin